MTVEIVELFQPFLDYVVAELSEGDMCLSVVLPEQLSKGCLGIVYLDLPLIYQQRSTIHKLLLR